MKFPLILCSIALATLALFFLIPHHRRKPESFKACTLFEIYYGLLREIPRSFRPSQQLLLLAALSGLFAALYPILLTLMLHHLHPAEDPSGWFLVAGIIALPGSIANFLAIIVSHLNFGWGVSSSNRDQTPFIWLIPSFHAFFALASLVFAFSPTAYLWAARLIGG